VIKIFQVLIILSFATLSLSHNYSAFIDPQFVQKEILSYHYIESNNQQRTIRNLLISISSTTTSYEIETKIDESTGSQWSDFLRMDRETIQPLQNNFWYKEASTHYNLHIERRWDYAKNKIYRNYTQTDENNHVYISTSDFNIFPYYMSDTMVFGVAPFIDVSKPLDIQYKSPWIIVQLKSDKIESISIGETKYECQKLILTPKLDLFFFSIPIFYKTSYFWLSRSKKPRLVKAEINLSDDRITVMLKDIQRKNDPI